MRKTVGQSSITRSGRVDTVPEPGHMFPHKNVRKKGILLLEGFHPLSDC